MIEYDEMEWNTMKSIHNEINAKWSAPLNERACFEGKGCV